MSAKKAPYISVIVPIYKTPLNYFKECLESLHNQTMQDAEFILVFDGENEELFSICKTYKETDNRFSYFNRPHLGVSATRNYGIDQAKGEFITFVDADDSFYTRTSLEECFSTTVNNNSDIFIFDWASDNHTIHSVWSHNIDYLSPSEIDYCLQQTIYASDPNFTGAPWSKFFRRDFVTANKIKYKERCVIGQDRVFNYEAFSIAHGISYCSKKLYKYTTNTESATQQFRPNYLSIILNYIEELYFLAYDTYPYLIGDITIAMFYYSWDKCYMSPQNKQSLRSRISNLTGIVKSVKFQKLIKYVNTQKLPFIARIETKLLQQRITFWIYIHAIKKQFF